MDWWTQWSSLWAAWWSGHQVHDELLWGYTVWSWARIGKVMQLAGLPVILTELVGKSRIENVRLRLNRVYETSRVRLVPGISFAPVSGDKVSDLVDVVNTFSALIAFILLAALPNGQWVVLAIVGVGLLWEMGRRVGVQARWPRVSRYLMLPRRLFRLVTLVPFVVLLAASRGAVAGMSWLLVGGRLRWMLNALSVLLITAGFCLELLAY